MPTLPPKSVMLARLISALTANTEIDHIEFGLPFNPENHEILGDMTVAEKNLGVLLGTLNVEMEQLNAIYDAAEPASPEEMDASNQLTNLSSLARAAQAALNLSLCERFAEYTGYDSLAVLNDGQIAGIIRTPESNRGRLREALGAMLSGPGFGLLIMRLERVGD